MNSKEPEFALTMLAMGILVVERPKKEFPANIPCGPGWSVPVLFESASTASYDRTNVARGKLVVLSFERYNLSVDGRNRMSEVSALRLVRLRKGLTLDEVFFETKGQVSPPRLSRIERGLSKPTPIEAAALIHLLGVSEDVVDSAPVFAPDSVPALVEAAAR